MPRLCSVCRCSLADGHSPRCVTCQVSQLADGRLAALTAALGQQTTRHPAAHSVYPAPAPPAPVDITLASGILITLAFCLLSRPERGVCRCLCPCCLPSGTLRIRDSLLFRERPAPASPILFPLSHLRLHCRACRQCHAAPLFRLQMLTCRRTLAALRDLPSLATCRREACGTDSSPRTADDTTSGCTQCLSRPRASGTR